MRIWAIAIAGVLVAVPDARAGGSEERAALQAKGEQLAKEGRYGEAIDAFKAADRIEPRASHACLIALAYTRRELWPQAELFLAKCHARATPTDPLPDWVPLADKQLSDRLQAANVASITIAITPPTAKAQITVSSFAPDEVFEPRVIYLPPGKHVIFAKAEGHPDQQATVEIVDKTARTVSISFEQRGPISDPHGPDAVVSDERRQPSRLGAYLMIGGGVTALVGVGFHVRMGQLWSDLDKAPDDPAYERAEGPYETARIVTIAAYAASAGLLVTGYLLHRQANRESAQVSAMPLPEGGALVSFGWTR